jgi:hypothetical protein
MSTLPAGYFKQRKVTSARSSGSLGLLELAMALVTTIGMRFLKVWTISILANTVRPPVDCRLDDTAFGAGTFSWQEQVHSWKAGPDEIITVENFYQP